MIVSNLKSGFDELLTNANEIWFAVALIKNETYDYIQESINENCKQHYLVGIDLPTNPIVLHKMQAKLERHIFEASIYKTDNNYHPKVYLFKVDDNYIAFVGSSNLTDGGLEDNIELNYKITNQNDCSSILDWFNTLYSDAYPLTDENIIEYEAQFNSITDLESQLKKRRKFIKLKRPNKIADNSNPLELIDFSDRYFKKEHHMAFRKELWSDSSRSANNERIEVQDKFLELNDIIFPKFTKYGIDALEHNTKNHIVSMYQHIVGATSQELGAMWLSYGKSQDEIKRYKDIFQKVPNKKVSDEDDKMSFINHARLQIRIDLESIAIWLLFGKNNGGSLFDRDTFRKNMKLLKFRNDFYSRIKLLPTDYFIYLNKTKKFCKEFNSSDELNDFCKKDNSQEYFYIGKNYQIEDDEMSENNLPEETLKVFKLLFPLYDMMIDK